jgi:hypothetical protein
MKIEIWKSKSSKQYTVKSGLMKICVCTGRWRKENGINKQNGIMLFYGSAYDNISRKFAADILKQFRRDARLMKGGAK